MAHPTIFILVLVAAGISETLSQSVVGHEASIGEIMEMSNRGNRDHHQSFECKYNYADPQSCDRYYECRNGYSTLKYCNHGKLYDSKKEECRDRRNVKCETGREKDSSEERSSEESNESRESHQSFECPANSGRYPDPKSCERYYECKKGRSTPKHCHRGKLFDRKRKECSYKRDVKCEKEREKDSDEDKSGEKVKEKDFKCPYDWGTFAHPNDCSKYFVCLNKTPKLFQCDKYLLFEDRIGKCLHRERVKCGKRLDREGLLSSTAASTTQTSTTTSPTTTTLSPTTTTQAPTTTQTPTTTTQAPTTTTVAPTTATVARTTTTTVTPTTTTTVAPTTTTTVAPTTTTQAPTTTTVAPSTTTVAPTTTTQAPTTVTFPTETEFPVTKPNTPPPTDCDEGDLDCIIKETGDVKGWFDCPEQFGHFPHGSSTQLFIHCDNWKPFVKKCADKTHFSPEHLVCIW